MSIEPQKSIYKQFFDIQVNAPNSRYKASFEITNSACSVVGIALTSDKEAQAYFRGTQSVKINDFEVFPEGYESRFLMFGLGNDLDKRFYPLSLPAGNHQVEVVYEDTEVDPAKFSAYRVRFYIFSSPVHHA